MKHADAQKIAAKIDSFNRGGQSGPGNTWGAPPMPFGTPTLPNIQTWSNAPGTLTFYVLDELRG